MPQLPTVLKNRNFHFSLIGVLLIALISLNVVAFSYFDDTTLLFSGGRIDFDDPEAGKAREYGAELCEKIVEEGLVLLKNENSCLPLKEKRVNIFGYGGSLNGFIHQGGGSARTSDKEKTSLFDSLLKAGLEPNQELWDYYSSLPYRRYPTSSTPSLQFRCYEASLEDIGLDRIEDAKDYCDNAIYVISRPAAEKLDLPNLQYGRAGEAREGTSFLHLTQEEEGMLNYLKEKFEDVIVVLNSANPFELTFADDSKVDSIIQMGFPGNTGAIALGKVLTGEVSPSGRLVDTFAKDITTNPTYINSSTHGYHHYSGRNDARYVDYAESIYLGYRYYETYARDFNLSEEDYHSIVAYPFGHGLSYTEFSWELEAINLHVNNSITPFVSGSDIPASASISVELWVENVGQHKGREVVEIYGNAPYYDGGIEKAVANLLCYGKTASLKPGKGERLTFTIPIRQFSSYDCFDSNLNGFMGEELEKGIYSFSFNSNAHDLHPLKEAQSPVFTFELMGNTRFEKDDTTLEPKQNLFTTFTNPTTNVSSKISETESLKSYSIDGNDLNQNIDYLSRSEIVESFPKMTPTRSLDTDAYVNNFICHDPRINEGDEHPEFGAQTNFTITDAFGKDINDPVFDSLVSQCKKDELIALSTHAGFQTMPLVSIGKPYCVDLDGPCGINTSVLANDPGNATSYPCASLLAQTWSNDLCYAFGQAIAKEANAIGLNGWYAPAANLHRSPLSGRNFEYFSEDPLVCGQCATYVCLGAIEGGVYCYLKHFVADENESGTNSQYHWLTEQALREIYAKPFEIAVKKAHVNAIMASKNRVGSVRCSGSDALLKKLLRQEWGFRGSVISDYYRSAPINDSDEAIRAGCDIMLEGTDSTAFDETKSATFEIALKSSAKNVIFTYCDTMYRSNIAQGQSFDHHTGSKKALNFSWIFFLVGIDVGALALLGGYFVLIKKNLKPLDPPKEY